MDLVLLSSLIHTFISSCLATALQFAFFCSTCLSDYLLFAFQFCGASCVLILYFTFNLIERNMNMMQVVHIIHTSMQ
jgi:hypothetical protein